MVYLLRKRYSPEQIAGKLQTMTDTSFEKITGETGFNVPCALPVGELGKGLKKLSSTEQADAWPQKLFNWKCPVGGISNVVVMQEQRPFSIH